jgi:hypothetical protein
MELLLLIVLVLIILGALPHWPYMQGRNYGYFPSLGAIVVLLLVVWLFFGSGHLHLR